MRRSIILFLMRRLASAYRLRFYDSVNLTRAFDDVAQEGIVVRGTGFVFDTETGVSGLYLVDYKNDIMENRYGRYN